MSEKPHHADVIIIGAGAAGLATAIFAARQSPTARIVLLDGARKVGAKILVAGGGRCNVTNARVTPADYLGGNPNVLRRILAAFTETDTRAFFEELDVTLHEEEDGKLFPDTHRARTVLDALLGEIHRRGVTLLSLHRVTAIDRRETGFAIHTQTPDGPQTFHAPRAVLATGGQSLPKTGSDGSGYALATKLGHSLVPTTPALAPLLLKGPFHQRLSGITHPAQLSLHAQGDKPVRLIGSLLWTHFGLSGPVAMNLSRFWHRAQREGRHVHVTASFVPGTTFENLDRDLVAAAKHHPHRQLHTALRELVPARLAEALAVSVGVTPNQELGRLTRDARRAVIHALTAWCVPIVGTRGYNDAEVTAGGIPLAEINPTTLESRRCQGLYLVGEILDVDGRIGGFNFQWAWSTAHVAATALARALSTDLA